MPETHPIFNTRYPLWSAALLQNTLGPDSGSPGAGCGWARLKPVGLATRIATSEHRPLDSVQPSGSCDSSFDEPERNGKEGASKLASQAGLRGLGRWQLALSRVMLGTKGCGLYGVQ
eukprot:2390553-Prymnesium_polylepis.1